MYVMFVSAASNPTRTSDHNQIPGYKKELIILKFATKIEQFLDEHSSDRWNNFVSRVAWEP